MQSEEHGEAEEEQEQEQEQEQRGTAPHYPITISTPTCQHPRPRTWSPCSSHAPRRHQARDASRRHPSSRRRRPRTARRQHRDLPEPALNAVAPAPLAPPGAAPAARACRGCSTSAGGGAAGRRAIHDRRQRRAAMQLDERGLQTRSHAEHARGQFSSRQPAEAADPLHLPPVASCRRRRSTRHGGITTDPNLLPTEQDSTCVYRAAEA